MIRNATVDDASQIADIYNFYLINTPVTFEEIPITGEEIARRIYEVKEKGLPWIVSEEEGQVVGYAYASKWRTRSAYRYTVESTIYLDKSCTGKGFGKPLYAALLDLLKGLGIHTVIGGITLPNPASVTFHESFGFKKVAHFHEVGYKQDTWLDVGFWEKHL